MPELGEPYYSDEAGDVFLGDSFDLLPLFPEGSFDMVFADPPYFLSNGGISCSGGRQVSVNKGAWDEGFTLDEKHEFNRRWIRLCKRVMKDTGTIWISGTLLHPLNRNGALGEERLKEGEALFQLRRHEGGQRRQADEGRLEGFAYQGLREDRGKAPDPEALISVRAHYPCIDT